MLRAERSWEEIVCCSLGAKIKRENKSENELPVKGMFHNYCRPVTGADWEKGRKMKDRLCNVRRRKKQTSSPGLGLSPLGMNGVGLGASFCKKFCCLFAVFICWLIMCGIPIQ